MARKPARKKNRKRNQAARTEFTPKNPAKYKGEYPIYMRSRWEIGFAINLDLSPSVLQWASEPVQIPYRDPVTGDQKVYVPDFLVQAVKTKVKGGRKAQVIETMLVEIKPKHEAFISEARNQKDAALVARNTAKWAAARGWCRRRGVKFIILTETDLFIQKKPKAKKKAA